MPENKYLEMVKSNGLALKDIQDQTPEICLEAVKQTGWALQFVKNQTEEICLAAVRQNSYALQFVKEQTSIICKEAVKRDASTIKYVKDLRLIKHDIPDAQAHIKHIHDMFDLMKTRFLGLEAFNKRFPKDKRPEQALDIYRQSLGMLEIYMIHIFDSILEKQPSEFAPPYAKKAHEESMESVGLLREIGEALYKLCYNAMVEYETRPKNT